MLLLAVFTLGAVIVRLTLALADLAQTFLLSTLWLLVLLVRLRLIRRVSFAVLLRLLPLLPTTLRSALRSRPAGSFCGIKWGEGMSYCSRSFG